MYTKSRGFMKDMTLFSVPRDQLSTFIREPQAIERNIGKVKTQLEVW